MTKEVPTWVVVVAIVVVLIIVGLIYWRAATPPAGYSGPPRAPEHPAAKMKGTPPSAVP
jgi:uncharacterized iron-regulated membrane protein